MDLKDAIEEEQILLDNIEAEADLNMDLKVDSKMPDYKINMENDATLHLQMKLPVVLKIKGDIQIKTLWRSFWEETKKKL